LNYGEQQWKGLVVDHLKEVELYSDEVRKNFEASLDWLHEHACSRSYGLGQYQYCMWQLQHVVLTPGIAHSP